ncbi:MAG: phage/plasmid primase, P4 family [Candidatus Thermoplasmatota archaeon]|nr:phage/plasmid primase, P4 family [Candidatus Thermoplasmatota archaeon]
MAGWLSSRDETTKDHFQKYFERRPIISIDGTTLMYGLSPESGMFGEGVQSLIKRFVMAIFEVQYQERYGNEVVNQVGTRTSITAKDLEKRKALYLDWVNLSNGALNVLTREFLPRTKENWMDFERFYFFHMLPVTYNPEAKCPNFDAFLDNILNYPEDREIAWEMIGYCLYRRYTIKNIFFLYGDPDTGKTTFLNVIEKLLGTDNVSFISWKQICEDRFESYKLLNKFANLAGEIGEMNIADFSMIKDISGNGGMSLRVMHSQVELKTHLYAKLIQAGNSLPKYNGKRDDGFHERLIIIRFDHAFTAGRDMDPYVLTKLTTPEELSGILNKALDALGRLLKRGYFNKSLFSKVMDAEEEWKRDPTYAYFNTFLQITNDMNDSPTFDDLYSNYLSVLRERNTPTMTREGFSRKLNNWIEGRSVKKREKEHKTVYSGLKMLHVSPSPVQ